MRLPVNASLTAIFIAGSVLLMFALAAIFPPVHVEIPQPPGIDAQALASPPVVSRSEFPSLQVDGSPIAPAGTFGVRGDGWPANQNVLVMLSDPDHRDVHQTIFLGQTNAQGSFAFDVLCQSDPRWTGLTTVQVSVQTQDQRLQRMELALVATPVPPTATPTVTPSPTPTQTSLPPNTLTPTPKSPNDSSHDQWIGEFFMGEYLSSAAPLAISTTKDLNLNWGLAVPTPNVPADHFSVRWTRKWIVGVETVYRFAVRADDGVRVFVDDVIMIDAWHPDAAPSQLHTQDVRLKAAEHVFRVEMYEVTGEAWIDFSFAPVEKDYLHWKGEYFANRELSGTPVVRDDAWVHFDWKPDSPPPGIPADNFSARWTRVIDFEPGGAYTFKVQTDAGVRLRVDNVELISQMNNTQTLTLPKTIDLTAGPHTVVIEYQANKEDANLEFVYEPFIPSEHWKGEYFDNLDFSGLPVWVHDDGAALGFGFDWGYGPPTADMPADNFAVRWTRRIDVDPAHAGDYRFSITSDDGMRLFIGDSPVRNEWHPSNSMTYNLVSELRAGSYFLRLEYFEARDQARIRLEGWTLIATPAP